MKQIAAIYLLIQWAVFAYLSHPKINKIPLFVAPLFLFNGALALGLYFF